MKEMEKRLESLKEREKKVHLLEAPQTKNTEPQLLIYITQGFCKNWMTFSCILMTLLGTLSNRSEFIHFSYLNKIKSCISIHISIFPMC